MGNCKTLFRGKKKIDSQAAGAENRSSLSLSPAYFLAPPKKNPSLERPPGNKNEGKRRENSL